MPNWEKGARIDPEKHRGELNYSDIVWAEWDDGLEGPIQVVTLVGFGWPNDLQIGVSVYNLSVDEASSKAELDAKMEKAYSVGWTDELLEKYFGDCPEMLFVNYEEGSTPEDVQAFNGWGMFS